MAEAIERKEFEGRKSLCDERFRRDKEDITDNKNDLTELRQLVTEMAAMQKQSMEQQKEQICQSNKAKDDQESRIRALEGKGGAWLDRLISLGLGAAIAALAGKIFGGA